MCEIFKDLSYLNFQINLHSLYIFIHYIIYLLLFYFFSILFRYHVSKADTSPFI